MANWSIVTAKNGTADGDHGPYKAPTGAGTVNTTGADLYALCISYYNNGLDPVAADISDVSGANTYLRGTIQNAAGDANARTVWFYCFHPTTSATEQWTIRAFGGGGSPPTSNVGYVAFAVTGSDGSTAPTQVSSGVTSSTPTGGSLGTSGQLVLSCVGNYSVDTSSIGSSFAIVQHNAYTAANNMGIGAAWNNSSAGVSGAVNPQWTMSGSPTANTVNNLAFTPAGGGGLTPGGGALALSGTTALLGLGLNPSIGSLALTGGTPSIGQPVTFSPNGGVLALAGGTPVIPGQYDPAGAALALALFTTTMDLTLIPGTGALNLSGGTPLLTALFAPTGAALGLTGSTPGVDGPKVFSPLGGALVLTGGHPTTGGGAGLGSMVPQLRYRRAVLPG